MFRKVHKAVGKRGKGGKAFCELSEDGKKQEKKKNGRMDGGENIIKPRTRTLNAPTGCPDAQGWIEKEVKRTLGQRNYQTKKENHGLPHKRWTGDAKATAKEMGCDGKDTRRCMTFLGLSESWGENLICGPGKDIP